jgi:biopolymer transport protein ExbD
MAISSGGDAGGPMSEINTTPLVDVMLVLLIIFLIAIPVVIQTVDLELPVVKFEPTESKNSNILLAVTTTDPAGLDPGDAGYAGAFVGGECRVYVNTKAFDSAGLLEYATEKNKNEIDALGGPAAIESGQVPLEDLPEAHIRGDINTPYRCIGATIFAMQRAGFSKIGFVSSPIDLNVQIK